VNHLRQKLLLLDANVVIECYRISAWDTLIDSADVSVPSIVAQDEVRFYRRGKVQESIHLPSLIKKGKIKEVSADLNEMLLLRKKLEKVLAMREIHEGELEALAIVSGREEEYSFVSGDKVAIHALAILDCSDKGDSLEGVLKSIGITKKLNHEFTDSYFRYHLREGAQMRIQYM
jgi:hypothetical protein